MARKHEGMGLYDDPRWPKPEGMNMEEYLQKLMQVAAEIHQEMPVNRALLEADITVAMSAAEQQIKEWIPILRARYAAEGDPEDKHKLDHMEMTLNALQAYRASLNNPQ